jgi:hypothetical protein
MSQNEQASGQRSRSSRGGSSSSGREPSKSRSDEWSGVEDPSERRKIQNKLAQRRFRRSHYPVHIEAKKTNVLKVTKSVNKKKRRNAKWRINDAQEVRTPHRSRETLTQAMNCQAYHGAAYRCGTLWKRARARIRARSGVLGRILYMQPLHERVEAVGERPRCQWSHKVGRTVSANGSIGSVYTLQTTSPEATQPGDTSHTEGPVEI